MNRLRVIGLICVALLFFAGTLGACSDDEDPGGAGNFEPGNQTPGDPELDVGDDADEPEEDVDDDEDVEEEKDPCVDVECSDGMFCQGGECIEGGLGYSCADPMRLNLNSEGTKTVTGNPSAQPPTENTSCSDDGDESPQMVFGFSVDQPTLLTARVANSEHLLVNEMRVGQCDNHTLADGCSMNEQNWVVEPDLDHFMIVEANSGWMVGEFELELEVVHLVCEAGERNCREGNMVRCSGGMDTVEVACPFGCEEGECIGDSCSNPLVVDGSMSMEVNTASFHNLVDFGDSPSCSSLGAEGPTTNGQDLVVSLPGLTAGQTVQATSPGGYYRIGLLEECQSAPQCVVGNSTGGELNWEVDVSGDYFVIFNRATSTNEDAEFSIDIVD